VASSISDSAFFQFTLFLVVIIMLRCEVDDASESSLRSALHRIVSSRHKVCVDDDSVQDDDVSLPLSVEAQLVHSIVDRVSLLSYHSHCKLTSQVHALKTAFKLVPWRRSCLKSTKLLYTRPD